MSLFYGPCLMLYWNDLLQASVNAFFLPNSISRLRHFCSYFANYFRQMYPGIKQLILTIFTRVWKHVVLKGDTVIGGRCGYGYDTLAMVNMLADELARTVFMQCIFRMMLQRILLCQKSCLIPTRCPLTYMDLQFYTEFLLVFFFLDTRSGMYQTQEVIS